MIISVFDREENIVGKGEIACTSNFSFSHNVFKRLLSQRRQKVSLCGNGLTLSQTSPGFYMFAVQVLLNTVGKREIARDEQFLLFPQCFLPFWRTFYHVHRIWNCRLLTLSIWKSLKSIVWERVNSICTSYITMTSFDTRIYNLLKLKYSSHTFLINPFPNNKF